MKSCISPFLVLLLGKERVEVQQRLDTVQHRYDGVTHKSEDRLNQLSQALPLATEFEEKHEELSTWLDDAEKDLQSLDGNAPAEEQKQKQQVCMSSPLSLPSSDHPQKNSSRLLSGEGGRTTRFLADISGLLSFYINIVQYRIHKICSSSTFSIFDNFMEQFLSKN